MPPLPPPNGMSCSARLPGHRRGEPLELVERDVLVIADAALVGAEDVVVLDAIALEELERPVVHADREVDDELVLRLRQDERGVARQLHRLGRLLELQLDDVVEVALLLLGRLVASARAWSSRRGSPVWRRRVGCGCGSFCDMVGTFLSSQTRARSNEFTSRKHAAPRRRRRRRPRRQDSPARGRDLSRPRRATGARRPASSRARFRGARELRSVERRFVGEAVYGMIRWRRRLGFAIGSEHADAAGALPRLARRRVSRRRRRSRRELRVDGIDPARLADVEARLGRSPTTTSASAIAQSYPTWLVARLVAERGRDDTEKLLAAMNHRAPLTARANRLKNTREELSQHPRRRGRADASRRRWRPTGSSCVTHVNAYGLRGVQGRPLRAAGRRLAS